MDYAKLRSFITLARTLHFARAAAEVSLTQPALSQHIQSLEQNWGVKLFERNKRQVSLTQQGQLLLDEAERTVQRLENLRATVKEVAAGSRGVLRLGYVGTAVLEPLLVSALRSFRSQFPQTRLEPAEYNVNQQIALLQSGELDVGILRGPIPDFRCIARCEIHQSALSVVVPDNHPRAGDGAIALQDLANETLILQQDPEGIGLGGTMLRLFTEADLVPVKIVRARDVNTAINLAAMGIGITCIPSSQRNFLRQDVAALDITGTDITTSLYLCWKAGRQTYDMQHFIKNTRSLFMGLSDEIK
ncbi:LysR family transcriptional regulator [Candidatus Pantoea alvi]|uniref:LysR family transcriptional regulator n=1 Tax=Enterobacter agglomerans TaxID=549 RepID=UPI000CDE070E|nr:LysR family transcriptional regulator [Pantoea agglomerans]POW58343.1 LysR family transcriptional regulator [Pantoea alvi]UBN53499.1 LysR family transcriptional regulator [Pantoea agglomerans]